MPACFWANMERTENMELEKIKELIQGQSLADLTQLTWKMELIIMKAGKTVG